MEFKAEIRSYISRYYAGLVMLAAILFGFFIHSLDKGFLFFEVVKEVFFSGGKLTLVFLFFPFLFQLQGYFFSRKHTKLLTLNKSSLTFNFFNKTNLTLKYSEIESLDLTKDMFKNFEFTLKNGDKKVVYTTIKERGKAFDLINEEIN